MTRPIRINPQGLHVSQGLVVQIPCDVDPLGRLSGSHAHIPDLHPQDEGAAGKVVFVLNVRFVTDVPVPENSAAENTLHPVTITYNSTVALLFIST